MKSIDYWAQRADQRMKTIHDGNDEIYERLKYLYNTAKDAIIDDVNQIQRNYLKWYPRQSTQDAIGRLMNPPSVEEYNRLAILSDIAIKALGLDENDLNDDTVMRHLMSIQNPSPALAFLQNVSMQGSATPYAFRIQRALDRIGSLDKRISELSGEVTAVVVDRLTKVVEDSYKMTGYELAVRMERALNIDMNTARIAEEILRNPWSGKNYSERIWGAGQELSAQLHEIIDQGLWSGASTGGMAQSLANWADERYRAQMMAAQAAGDAKRIEEIQKLMDRSYKNAERLVRTETTFVVNQAALTAYKQSGVEKYRFVAVMDDRTSEICKSLDMQVFLVSEAAIGVNLPPMHPNCRSTITAEIDEQAQEYADSNAIRDAGTGETVPMDEGVPQKAWEKIVQSGESGTLGGQAGQIEGKLAQIGMVDILDDYDSKVHNREVINISDVPHKPPLFGKLNSIVDLLNIDDSVRQRRLYDNTGAPALDIDTSDHNQPKNHPFGAHAHDWEVIDGKPMRKNARRFTLKELMVLIDIIKRGVNYFGA